jgi:GNAT superfamily N-acetyltransferase
MSALPTDYVLTDDQSQIDALAAHAFLTTSYWSTGIPVETVQRAIANSFCVAVRHNDTQVAFARVVTDYAVFGYLADVYALEEHRGLGLGQLMVTHFHNHPRLQGLRRWALFTLDAQGVYAKLGWQPLQHPERAMERHFPDIYA